MSRVVRGLLGSHAQSLSSNQFYIRHVLQLWTALVFWRLQGKCRRNREGWIFPSKRAGEGHLTTVTKQFEKARKEAELPNDLVLYCARHGFGTEMYRAAKNLFAVMNVMGHTTVSTTMKYQHQNIDEVAELASHRVQ
jgi:integrase